MAKLEFGPCGLLILLRFALTTPPVFGSRYRLSPPGVPLDLESSCCPLPAVPSTLPSTSARVLLGEFFCTPSCLYSSSSLYGELFGPIGSTSNTPPELIAA
jgi:hypothetical protein